MTQEVNRSYETYFYKTMKDRPLIIKCSTYEQVERVREEKKRLGIYMYFECIVSVTYRKERDFKKRSYKLCSEGPLQGWVW